MNRKYTVEKYSIMLLKIITQKGIVMNFILFPSAFQLIYNEHIVTLYLQKIFSLFLKELRQLSCNDAGFCLFACLIREVLRNTHQ